ncbi:MAG: insulinase family protein [Deltaproteobacteria bacterium]|nr:insulinase family protein [Deltaproteobacteria bacterium]
MFGLPLVLAALAPLVTPAEVPPPSPPAAATEPVAPEPASDAQGAVPMLPFERSVLDNGLSLIVHTDPTAPVVCVDLWYRAGVVDEERGKSGMARLFEHLMYQGSKHNPGDNHTKLLEGAGASFLGGGAGLDATSYVTCVPKHELELALWLEADRMAWLMEVTDAAKIDEQRKVIIGERRAAIDEAPYGPGRQALWQAIFPADHPYRTGLYGAPGDLDKLTLADAQAFFDRHSVPAAATLVLAGDVTVDDAKKLVDKYFRSLPKAERAGRRSVPMPKLGAELRVELEDRSAPLPTVTMAFFTPPALQNGSADIEVLAYLLGDGNASRLHQALVVDGKMATSVRTSLLAAANVSVLTLEATVRQGINADDVLSAIQAQLDLLQDLPPSGEELARAVATFETRRLSSLRHLVGRAELLQSYQLYAGEPGFLPKDLARFRAVTPESTLAAVNGFLTRDRRAVAVVRPAGAPPAPPPPAPSAEPPATPAEPAKEGG